MSTAPLARLAALAGVATSYRDSWGEIRYATDDTLRGLIHAMGIAVDGRHEVEESIRALYEAPWRRPLALTAVAHPQNDVRIAVTVAEQAEHRPLAWRITNESGDMRAGNVDPNELPLVEARTIDGVTYHRRRFTLPVPVGLGYHDLSVEPADHESPANLRLIVAPPRCHPLSGRGDGGRAWGVAVQLYGLTSDGDWGAGDFTDLTRLAESAAALGADAIGLNPIHALFPGNPSRISPYSPSDRRFLSVLYLDIAAIADLADAEDARALLADPGFQTALATARAATLVDYTTVLKAKLAVLHRLYAAFRRANLDGPGGISGRGAAFRTFQRAGGDTLARFALFQALSDHFGPNAKWTDWPAAYRDPASPDVAEFASAHADRVEFFAYLQWQASGQLGTAQTAAKRAGMAVGLYHDLALAPDPAGAEAWTGQALFAHDVAIGAPPDDWNLKGQNWALRPYNPSALMATGCIPYADMIRANMSHAGALRIDHMMGLERLFWIPDGAEAKDGSYVRYPADELFAVLALESHRKRCAVIGEDLGTLPEGFQERMRGAGILSYRLIYFAHAPGGGPLPPDRYPAEAAVAVSTHDLATLAGYWNDADLDLRRDLELYPAPAIEKQARATRARERKGLVAALRQAKLLPADPSGAVPPFSFQLALAVYRYLARTPSRLLLVQLEDVLGVIDQANLPGTVDEHPNWRRKLPTTVAGLAADARIRALADAIGSERGVRPHLP